MTAVLAIQAHRGGKSLILDMQLEISLLNALFDAVHPMTVIDLETQLRCHRRDLFRAITAQYRLGNVRKGQPVELTKSARIAITAGRCAIPRPIDLATTVIIN